MSNVKSDFSRYEIRYREFPELLFTVRGDGCEYFDAFLYKVSGWRSHIGLMPSVTHIHFPMKICSSPPRTGTN